MSQWVARGEGRKSFIGNSAAIMPAREARDNQRARGNWGGASPD
jgi:hypothetical protein